MKLLTSAFKITWVEIILGHIKKKKITRKVKLIFFFFRNRPKKCQNEAFEMFVMNQLVSRLF